MLYVHYFYPKRPQMDPLWDVINTINDPTAGLQQNLVLIPSQYKSQDAEKGTERVFTKMEYMAYYEATESDNCDTFLPNIWSVQYETTGDANMVNIDVGTTDFDGVRRVVVVYTTDEGAWETLQLSQDARDGDIWTGSLPKKSFMEFFVQAVDAHGNVAVHDNKGAYFTDFLIVDQEFLPIISI
ncbi:MAG: hypothetical protein AAF639_32410 [Chloroflexota bacterium]